MLMVTRIPSELLCEDVGILSWKIFSGSPSDQQLENKSPYTDLSVWGGMWSAADGHGFLYFAFSLWFLYSSIYHHHFPFPVCCDVWGLWPWYFDDPFCCMDGIEGEPDPLSEEWEWGNVCSICVGLKLCHLSNIHYKIMIWESFIHAFTEKLQRPLQE